MLIPSPRHKKEDLILWADYLQYDLLNARRSAFQPLIDKSIGAILDFTKTCPAYCVVSWGKDSVVVAHLIYTISQLYKINIPLYWVNLDEVANPDCFAVRDLFLSKFNLEYHEINVDAYDKNGDLIATGRLEKGFAEVVKHSGTERYISGIRADESSARRARVRHWGYSTKNTCAPLAFWTAQDVFSYMAIHDLPVHPVYAMLGGGRWERKHLRVSSIGGARGQQFGRLEWEKQYYRDVLIKTKPELYL